jgi:hypothetical protein
MTTIELMNGLVAFTEHRKDCTWRHGRTFDAAGHERACTCGLGPLLAAVKVLEEAPYTDELSRIIWLVGRE